MAQSTESRSLAPRLGAWVEDGPAVRWRVWAPGHKQVEAVLYDAEDRVLRMLPLTPEAEGCFGGALPGQGAGLRYKLRLDGGDPFPDPWSRSQPAGVHGPSEVVVADHGWTDLHWKGPDPKSLVIYEVHVGTATPEGTFEAFIPKLAHLR
ncbi:MAG: malto-oligosyltrehalose trehalohydrolase, partial [Myxococcaceae bacterium]